MKTRIHADEWSCDGCEKKTMEPVITNLRVGDRPESVPDGWLVGKTERDYQTVEWHAHAIGCVRKAIEAAFARSDEQPSAGASPEEESE